MAQFFPMIQTHNMKMAPYLPDSQGYAFFISSSLFTGKEIVTVTAPKNTLLPDTGTNSRVLTQYSGSQWYISDKDRITSAQGGPLSEGDYTFTVQSEKTYEVVLNHKNAFLSVPQDIRISDLGPSVDVTWISDPRATTSWIFACPTDTKNILKDLIAISSVMHLGDSHSFEKNLLKPGKYKIAIRSNQFWEGGTFWGLQSEAWSISAQEFEVK